MYCKLICTPMLTKFYSCKKWVLHVPTKTSPKSLPLGERLRLLKQSAMNSRLPNRTVLPREMPP
jgi:hypothetical protein